MPPFTHHRKNLKGVLFGALILLNFLTCEKQTTFPPPVEQKGTLEGVVKDQDNQQPIGGAFVELLINQVSDTTDTLGSFRLTELIPGMDTLVITAAGHDTLYSSIEVAQTNQQLTLFLKQLQTPPDTLTCIPVEDTSRVYISPNSGTPMRIYSHALFARFYPEVTDTNEIKEVLAQYNLQKTGFFFGLDGQWAAYLCITDGTRAECHFTPYGREGFDNFGTHPIVEYAFGVFNEGFISFWGNIWFKFVDGTSQTSIDSLYAANGLRFLRNASRGRKVTLITPQAPKNVLDLGEELHSIPFVDTLFVELATSPTPIQCEH